MPNGEIVPNPGVAFAPENLSARGVSSQGIDLSWTERSTNETGFAIERGFDGINFVQIATVGPVTSYADRGLRPDTTFYYRGEGDNSRRAMLGLFWRGLGQHAKWRPSASGHGGLVERGG